MGIVAYTICDPCKLFAEAIAFPPGPMIVENPYPNHGCGLSTLQLEKLREKNQNLRREARALAGDPAALERAAREELGYVRPGERVYELSPGGGKR